jgi:Ca2+/Na+ antiporter
LDAVASSMPELFTGIFFVVVAVGASNASQEQLVEKVGDGYGAAIATCAGSAVYNMILIPAICGLVISYTRKSRPTIDVDSEVISRDGLWFIGAELLLILFLFQEKMYWWMGVLLLLLYGVYVFQLYRDAKRYRRAHDAVAAHIDEVGRDADSESIATLLRESGIWATPVLVDRVRAGMNETDDDEDDDDDSAGMLFGFVEVPLNHVTAWLIIAASTLVAAVACYWLVEVTLHTASAIGLLVGREIPIFFVAVIIAAAASSVPDTFLSIGSAKRGDDSGAVSNAFGSNIFDICFSLSIPLLISSYLVGWQPISLTQNGEPMPGLVDLRVLLVGLSFITLLIMWHQRQLTRGKSFVLIGMYGLFIV